MLAKEGYKFIKCKYINIIIIEFNVECPVCKTKLNDHDSLKIY